MDGFCPNPFTRRERRVVLGFDAEASAPDEDKIASITFLFCVFATLDTFSFRTGRRLSSYRVCGRLILPDSILSALPPLLFRQSSLFVPIPDGKNPLPVFQSFSDPLTSSLQPAQPSKQRDFPQNRYTNTRPSPIIGQDLSLLPSGRSIIRQRPLENLQEPILPTLQKLLSEQIRYSNFSRYRQICQAIFVIFAEYPILQLFPQRFFDTLYGIDFSVSHCHPIKVYVPKSRDIP